MERSFQTGFENHFEIKRRKVLLYQDFLQIALMSIPPLLQALKQRIFISAYRYHFIPSERHTVIEVIIIMRVMLVFSYPFPLLSYLLLNRLQLFMDNITSQ
jgi:hypothetical protein